MENLVVLVALLLTFGGCMGFYLAIVSLRNMRLARILAVAGAIGLVMMTVIVGRYLDAEGGEWWWTLLYIAFACAILHLAFKKYPHADRTKPDDEDRPHDRPD